MENWGSEQKMKLLFAASVHLSYGNSFGFLKQLQGLAMKDSIYFRCLYINNYLYVYKSLELRNIQCQLYTLSNISDCFGPHDCHACYQVGLV